ncbi:MAG TPA: hypothetical protein VLA88_01690 [Candidatus Saccharimonadales bacterium]|nr:hypothetical protein [Candidatus Saccharimonadales bacterium]
MRLHLLGESRKFHLMAIAVADPGLALTCRLLRQKLPPSADIAAFNAAAERGDVVEMLRHCDLPGISLDSQPSLMFLLQAVGRREHNLSVIGTEMDKLEAILRHISHREVDAAALTRLVAAVSLGDPVGCVCPPGENHWHPDANRFDLIAYEILALNGLRRQVWAELEQQQFDDLAPATRLGWRMLLRDDCPFPAWKE